MSVDRRNYEAVRAAVLATLRARGEMTPEALRDEVERRLRGRFPGSVSWYYTTVKLDLEARKEIERVPRSRPQRVRLRGAGPHSGARAGTVPRSRSASRGGGQRRVSRRRR